MENVLATIKEFFEFIAGIIKSFFDFFKGLIPGDEETVA